MKKTFFVLSTIALMSACSSVKKTAIVPTTSKSDFEDTYTIIWNGKSEAYRYIDGEYKRDETYDYVFNVVQKRYDNVWKSTKTLHRNHPDYDFRGGQRSQTMYFQLNYAMNDDNLSSTLNSSLGSGKGTSDIEFRNQTLIIQLDTDNPYYNISKYTPFNRMKITQQYKYEEGLLLEIVELYKEDKNGKVTPFSKMEETAVFYIKGKLDKAPTIFNYVRE
ncbi:hypothetical protein [Leadbetterella sp. DM7]|uniref:hypothetical protein n=1 Tax=Leadbetterella sp. DM7 TaxID=3235085 RepID=UPI00349E4E59